MIVKPIYSSLRQNRKKRTGFITVDNRFINIVTLIIVHDGLFELEVYNYPYCLVVHIQKIQRIILTNISERTVPTNIIVDK